MPFFYSMNIDRWLIVGLGNPGDKYAHTRHNAGFMLLDRLAERLRAEFRQKDESNVAKGLLAGREVILLKPLTYMNLSGRAVRKALVKANLLQDGEINNLIVVHDDLDLAPGVLKIRSGGSSGGHRGIESIINETGGREFVRVKIGIGRDSLVPAEDYVLRRFKPDEKGLIGEALEKAEDAVEMIVAHGVEKAMNKYNRTARPEGTDEK
jgi:PTH1 family peptidyl-tRNA hydrolase